MNLRDRLLIEASLAHAKLLLRKGVRRHAKAVRVVEDFLDACPEIGSCSIRVENHAGDFTYGCSDIGVQGVITLQVTTFYDDGLIRTTIKDITR